jgi:hypothetical protein
LETDRCEFQVWRKRKGESNKNTKTGKKEKTGETQIAEHADALVNSVETLILKDSQELKHFVLH